MFKKNEKYKVQKVARQLARWPEHRYLQISGRQGKHDAKSHNN